MADWVLIPCLKALFAEFDRIAPARDHASDGSIGNAAHEREVSDHNPDETGSVPIHDADHLNEVHAIDVDNTLRAGDLTMEKVVQFLLGRCRSGVEKRLRYIIYNRRIWSAGSGWVQKAYTGASPHTEHGHFSASYETALEASTATWGLIEEFGDDMTKDEFMAWSKEFHAQTNNGFATWQVNGIGGAAPSYQVLADTAGRTNIIKADTAKILSALSEMAGKDFTDEAAIVQGVLAGLGPAAMTDAMVAALEVLPKETAKQVLDEMATRLSAG